MRQARTPRTRRPPTAVRLIRYPARRRAVPHPATRPRSGPAVRLATHGPPARPTGGLLGQAPDPGLAASARIIIQLLIEVLAGYRAPHHFAGQASEQVRDGFAGLRPRDGARRRAVPPRIIRLWVQHPAPDQAEAGAVAVLGDRVHAVAVRLERHRDRWRCSAVETTAAPA